MTTILISKATVERLKQIGRKAETYDQIINHLLNSQHTSAKSLMEGKSDKIPVHGTFTIDGHTLPAVLVPKGFLLKEQAEINPNDFILHQVRPYKDFNLEKFSTVPHPLEKGVNVIFGQQLADSKEQIWALFFFKAAGWNPEKVKAWLAQHSEYASQPATPIPAPQPETQSAELKESYKIVKQGEISYKIPKKGQGMVTGKAAADHVLQESE